MLGRHPTLDDLADGSFGRSLDIAKERNGGLHTRAFILCATERQDEGLARLGLPFGGLWGRPLHAIDCQGLFCETDKYCREAAPELASARKRIKARFTPTPNRSAWSSRPSGASTTACPSSRYSATAR